MDDYVSRAGGFTRDADKGRLSVSYMNGERDTPRNSFCDALTRRWNLEARSTFRRSSTALSIWSERPRRR